ncbi:hypothetical protein HYV49_00355 [Candidatus Pacearchaeota archaeon]|nr:hypothetical protein [Candidatus Pacearchaeota archaeon]
MARYTIFTEHGKPSVDFDHISGCLRGLDLKVLDTKDNSVVVEYDGNLSQFRRLADSVLNPMRNETIRIYIAAD